MEDWLCLIVLTVLFWFVRSCIGWRREQCAREQAKWFARSYRERGGLHPEWDGSFREFAEHCRNAKTTSPESQDNNSFGS